MTDTLTLAAFTPRGPTASTIAQLLWILLALGGFVYGMFLLALFLGLRRPRGSELRSSRGSHDDQPGLAPPTAATPQPFTQRWMMLGGVVLPTAVLIVAFGFTAKAMVTIADRADPDAMVVEVTGHQWWWEVTYPEAGVSTANEVHIPSGESVELKLRSTDVIHSFWVPELSGKLDAFPDYTNTLVIEADEPGRFEGSCAEFCGLHHARMPVVVVAHEPSDFAAWLAGQQQPAVAALTASEVEGQRVFTAAGCARCHTVRRSVAVADPRRSAGSTEATGSPASSGSGDSDSAVRTKAPDLTHQASRSMMVSLRRSRTRAELAAWIRDPGEIKTQSGMPATKLTQADMNALLDYLGILK